MMSGGFPEGTTLGTVVEAMAGLALAAGDGVRYFHQIYTEVTRAVAARVDAGAFEDTAFMVELDVEFAGLYLDAVRSPATAPRAWRVVFDRRFAPLEPLRFALAGMNAHINRDLAVALDTACTRLGGTLDRNSPRCRDFIAINDILVALMNQAKAELFSRIDRIADAALGPADDLFEAWSITAARDNAWTHGAVLHHLSSGVSSGVVPSGARAAALVSLDRTASLIGRLLLL
jgi:hypothetical protein